MDVLATPVPPGFFPQVVLTVEELMHYRRLTKARVAELARVVDDADCVYRWAPVRSAAGRAGHKAVFVDVRAASKASRASTLLKSSVHVVDVSVDEILSAVAKPKTRDARRAMGFMLADTFVDTQTLLSFPVAPSKRSKKRASFAYRAIKWAALRPPAQKRSHAPTPVDFCYVEYAGKCKPHAAGSVVGFCIQESVARDREVPSLEDAYGIRRGTFLRTGLIITRTHQSNILKVTSICQILHPPAPPTPLSALEVAQSSIIQQDEPLLLEYVTGVHRLKGLLERQRMGKLQYLDEWDWVPSADRKACAVCLRGFYFHRKHHCHTCGEVVCATCAPLRELDEPLLGRTDGPAATHKLRVCSLCMAQAGSSGPSDDMSGDVSEDEDEATTTTSNGGTDTYVRGLRYPPGYQHRRPQPIHSVDPRGRRSASERSSNVSDRSDALARKREALDKLVDHIRQIRDTLDEAISEVDEERASLDVVNGQPARHRGRSRAFVDDHEEEHDDEDEEVDPHSDDEQYDDIYERILQIRETLDRSSEFDAVLAAVGGRDSTVDGSRPSSGPEESFLGHSEDELGDSADLEFNLTVSSHESFSMLSGGSFASLSSASMSSVGEDESVDGDYETQGAGETLEVNHGETQGDRPHVHYADADDDAVKLQKALLWARQSDPLATDVDATRPHSDPSVVTKKLPVDEHQPSTTIPVVTVSKNRGIERLAMKIGRLQQRLEAAAARVDEDPQPEADPEEDPVKDGTVDGTADGTDVSSGRGSDSSSRSRVPPELVANLRGVMNSSELTRPPARRPSTPVDVVRPRGPPPPVPSTAPFVDSGRPPSPDPAPSTGTTIYVFDDAKVNKLQPRWVPARRAAAVDEDAAVDAVDGHVDIVDESEELRELMEGLAAARPSRSRCSSGQSSGAPPTEKFDF